jgi:4'-phosphopantetheinyl transferase
MQLASITVARQRILTPERRRVATLARVTYVVRIVQVALDRYADQLDELAELLPEGERAQQPQVRRARAATRDVLARTLGVSPATLTLTRECARCGDARHGKPVLVGEPLSFNVTHSGARALVAVGAAGHAIGVDAEEVQPRAHAVEKLAARTLNPEELARWRAVPETDQLTAYLQLWTAKEAYLKAIGVGITTDLRGVVVPPGWHCAPVPMPDGYVASLAVDAPAVELLFEEWRN